MFGQMFKTPPKDVKKPTILNETKTTEMTNPIDRSPNINIRVSDEDAYDRNKNVNMVRRFDYK